jgi:hypothetical protein
METIPGPAHLHHRRAASSRAPAEMETIPGSAHLHHRRIASPNMSAEMDTIPGQSLLNRFRTTHSMDNPAEMETIPGTTIPNSNMVTSTIAHGDNTMVQALAAFQAYMKSMNNTMTWKTSTDTSVITKIRVTPRLIATLIGSEGKGRTFTPLASSHIAKREGHTQIHTKRPASPFLTGKTKGFSGMEKHTMTEIHCNSSKSTEHHQIQLTRV